jgi:hypothetical protein
MTTPGISTEKGSKILVISPPPLKKNKNNKNKI